MNDQRNFARNLIVTGFFFTALGSIVNVISLIDHGYLGQGSFRADIQLIALPLGSLAALWAWWILSKIALQVTNYDAAFKSAFIGLAVVSFCMFVEYANYLWSTPTFNQFTWPIWLQDLGSLVTAVGFLVFAFSFSSVAPSGDPS